MAANRIKRGAAGDGEVTAGGDRRRWWFAGGALVLLACVVAAVGLSVLSERQKREETAMACKDNREAAAGAVARDDLAVARISIHDAKTNCGHSYQGEIENIERQINTKLEAEQREQARKHAVMTDADRQLEQDRREGVKVLKKGYLIATTLEKFQRASKYVAAGDREGYALFLRQDPDVDVSKGGTRVMVIERGGLSGGLVHVRIKGTLDELWADVEALEDP